MNAFSEYHLAKIITDTIFCGSLISVTFFKIQVLPVDYLSSQLQFFPRGPFFKLSVYLMCPLALTHTSYFCVVL